MTDLSKKTRFTILRIQDLSKDQCAKLILALELTMGVFSEFGWENQVTYLTLKKLHDHVKVWKDQGGPKA